MATVRQKASRLFLLHYNFVIGLAYHYAPQREIVDDIANDVFTEFVEHSSRWNLDEDVRPILVRLTRFRATEYWRQRMKDYPEKLQKVAEHLREVASSNAENVDGNEIFALRYCLDKLSAKGFQLIEMRYENKCSYETIAERLASTQGAIRQALCRIRDNLRQCIQRKLKAEEP